VPLGRAQGPQAHRHQHSNNDDDHEQIVYSERLPSAHHFLFHTASKDKSTTFRAAKQAESHPEKTGRNKSILECGGLPPLSESGSKLPHWTLAKVMGVCFAFSGRFNQFSISHLV
jgi:hypothetical protein